MFLFFLFSMNCCIYCPILRLLLLDWLQINHPRRGAFAAAAAAAAAFSALVALAASVPVHYVIYWKLNI